MPLLGRYSKHVQCITDEYLELVKIVNGFQLSKLILKSTDKFLIKEGSFSGRVNTYPFICRKELIQC